MKNSFFNKRAVGRGAIGAVFCVLILLASMVSAIDLTTESEEIEDLSYTYLFKAPAIGLTLANDKEYTTLHSDGCLAIAENAGDPAMPIKPISRTWSGCSG